MLALFVTSVAISVITTMTAYDGSARTTAADRATLVNDFFRPNPSGRPSTSVPSVPTPLLDLLVHDQPVAGQLWTHDLVRCADLARVPALGHCAPGARTAAIEPDVAGSKFQPAT
ncbi:MAG TPA: hypothetical protein VIV12_03700 [Streptosporangiaceae bacterium]